MVRAQENVDCNSGARVFEATAVPLQMVRKRFQINGVSEDFSE